MKRTHSWIFTAILMFVGVSLVLTGGVASQSADIVVAADGNGDYTSIQTAVDNAGDTDRIKVTSGTYEESVTIDKNVTLVAPERATLTPSPSGSSYTGISITEYAAPEVSGFDIEGFDIGINAGSLGATGPTKSDWSATDIIITGKSRSTGSGINALDSSGAFSVDNVSINNVDFGIYTLGTADSWQAQNITIEDTGGDAISAYQSTGAWLVENADIEDVGGDGVFAIDSDGKWTVRSTTIRNASNGINADGSSGDWKIFGTVVRDIREDAVDSETSSGETLLQNISVENSNNGIVLDDATGDWTITSASIENVSGDGVDAYNNTGDWVIKNTTIDTPNDKGISVASSSGDWMISETSINDSSSDAIFGESTSGDWTITGVTVSNASDMGVEVDDSTGNWTIQNTIVSNIGEDGIEVEDTSGDWTIKNSTIQNTGDDTIDASRATGNWKVHQSILQNAAGAGVAADNATEGNASYNYWGSADGPSGDFCGSGAEAYGNITMYPYYTDSSLTTLSSATTSGTVQISSSCVIPEDISESNEQELVLTLSQISADGQSDNITITMPEDVSVENVGEPRAIGTPYEVDVTSSGDPIKLEVDPDEPEATVDFVLRVPVELSSSGD